jgi:hypothetical protein
VQVEHARGSCPMSLRVGAERGGGAAVALQERAARAGRAGISMLLFGIPASAGWVGKTATRLSAQLGKAGCGEAMRSRPDGSRIRWRSARASKSVRVPTTAAGDDAPGSREGYELRG